MNVHFIGCKTALELIVHKANRRSAAKQRTLSHNPRYQPRVSCKPNFPST